MHLHLLGNLQSALSQLGRRHFRRVLTQNHMTLGHFLGPVDLLQ